MLEFAVSNELISDPKALREQADRDGYLFFKGLLDKGRLQDVRSKITRILNDVGWTAEGSDPVDGIAREGKAIIESAPEYMPVYNRILKLEAFHALAHDSGLTGMFDVLFQEPALVHARNIARIIFPQNEQHTTPAHQDYVHIQGTPDTWTSWIPLGDCPKELGVLAILAGSHRDGIQPVHSAYGAGGLGIDTQNMPYQWHTSSFEAGDVVVFHSHTIHKALPNKTSSLLRLSVDFRYQGISQPVVQSSFEPHLGQISWEEVYEDWTSDELKYYWKNIPLKLVEWTPEYHQMAGR